MIKVALVNQTNGPDPRRKSKRVGIPAPGVGRGGGGEFCVGRNIEEGECRERAIVLPERRALQI